MVRSSTDRMSLPVIGRTCLHAQLVGVLHSTAHGPATRFEGPASPSCSVVDTSCGKVMDKCDWQVIVSSGEFHSGGGGAAGNRMGNLASGFCQGNIRRR